MTRTQHYLEAERLLKESEYQETGYATLLATRAQVHATLALADSTVARTAGGEQSMFPPDSGR